MPYGQQSNQNHRQMPTTQTTTTVEYIDANGNTITKTVFTEESGPTNHSHFATQKHATRNSGSCGCFFGGDVAIHGVCKECQRDGTNGLLCQAHHVVCMKCGKSVCIKHSEQEDDSPKRLCTKCHRRQSNTKFFTGIGAGVKSFARSLFFE